MFQKSKLLIAISFFSSLERELCMRTLPTEAAIKRCSKYWELWKFQRAHRISADII